jgi:hypothetical protein
MPRQSKDARVVFCCILHILIRYPVLPVIDNLMEKYLPAAENDPAQAELFFRSGPDITLNRSLIYGCTGSVRGLPCIPVRIHPAWRTAAAVPCRNSNHLLSPVFTPSRNVPRGSGKTSGSGENIFLIYMPAPTRNLPGQTAFQMQILI